MSRVRDITKFLEETRKTNTNLKALRPSTTSTIDSAAVLVMKSASGMSVFSTLDSLPVTSLTTGQQAYVTETSRIYISNGNGWYNVAVVNATPSLTLSSSGTIALTAGAATTITMTATDSDNADANLVLSLESGGDLFKFATVSQDSSVVTITPRTEDSATALGSDGSATLTFKASDGVNQATVQNTFTLAFSPDWTGTATETFIRNSSYSSSGQDYGVACAVSGDGNYLCSGIRSLTVSGQGGSGAVEVWKWNGSAYAVEQEVVSDTAVASQYIGACFDINYDGTYLAVACDKHTSNRLYVFTRSGTTWTQQQQITPPGSSITSSEFGAKQMKIDKNANYIVVGDENVNALGAVYVFKRTGTSWSLDATISPPASVSNQKFGSHISVNEDSTYLVVGERGYSSWSGRMHVYTRSGSTWTLQHTFAPSNTTNTRNLSYGSINNAGDTILQTGNSSGNQKAFVWTRSGTTWTEQTILSPSDGVGSPDRQFGSAGSINASGNIAAVGAYNDNSGVGAIYIFDRTGSTWTQRKKLVPTINVGSAYDVRLTLMYYGKALDITESGDRIVACSKTNSYPNNNGYYGALWTWNV
jgi:6-phosphogluconolactonase (cycloisomerase 2 family)